MTSFIVLSKSFISKTFTLKLGLEPHTRTGGEKDHTHHHSTPERRPYIRKMVQAQMVEFLKRKPTAVNSKLQAFQLF